LAVGFPLIKDIFAAVGAVSGTFACFVLLVIGSPVWTMVLALALSLWCTWLIARDTFDSPRSRTRSGSCDPQSFEGIIVNLADGSVDLLADIESGFYLAPRVDDHRQKCD
jgi:hypothetical protein